jgi:Replication-relaxation
MTAEQIRRGLGLSSGSASYARELVSTLSRFGLIGRLDRDRPTAHGSMAGVYTPSSAGRRWLARRGILTPGRYRPAEVQGRSRFFLSHALVCVDVAISADAVCGETPDLELQRLWHERALRRRPSYVEVEGRRSAVIPDLLLDMDAAGDQVMVSCEVDLSSERGSAWKRKIARLVAWAAGPYRAAFATDSLTIAVIAPGDEKRTRTLWHQTEVALDAIGARSYGSLFLFTAQDPATAPPRTFWLAPGCLQPFNNQTLPLIEGWLP